MKKTVIIILTLALLAAFFLPACAWGESLNCWHWWRSWQPSSTAPEPEDSALPAPEITKATFTHKNAAYSGLDNRLWIEWNALDGADGYEVEITKADGTVETYTTSGPCLYEKAECPKMYVESTRTWTSATVRVRAMAGDDAGAWSEAEKISCNAIHG